MIASNHFRRTLSRRFFVHLLQPAKHPPQPEKQQFADPGNCWPQPEIFAKSFAEPRGICAMAGKLTLISSSVQMNPLPVSLRPSLARELSAANALKITVRVKEPV